MKYVLDCIAAEDNQDMRVSWAAFHESHIPHSTAWPTDKNCTVALVLGRSKISQHDTLFDECSQQVGTVFEPWTDSCRINCCSPLQRRYSGTGPTHTGKPNSPDVHHHERVKSTQSSFQRQVESLVAVFENMGNPFNEAGNDFLVLDTRDIADVKVSKTVREVVKERLMSLVERTKPILDVIKQNRLRCQSLETSEISVFQRETENGVVETELLTLLAALYENQSYPPSISCFGNLRSGQKAYLVKILEKVPGSPTEAMPVVEAILLADGAAVVNILKPNGARKTFADYVSQVSDRRWKRLT